LPGPGVLVGLIEAEHWALAVAEAAGLRAAESRIDDFDGRKAIVVTRYDRQDGLRLHQEDFCQALWLDPEAKYEGLSDHRQHGGRLARLARTAAARAVDPTELREQLLAAVTFNIALGNGDAHSKNYSLLLRQDGAVELAPLYDVAPIMHMDSRFRGTGHAINGRTNIDWLSTDDLIEEGVSWGIPQRSAKRVVDETMARTWEAAHHVEPPDGFERILGSLDRTFAYRSWPTAERVNP
jgi:serine/threonine-protein kinase HipA